MVRIGSLSDAQRQALERVRRRAAGRVSQRAHMVLLSARGYTVEQLAEILGVGEDVVRKWLYRYERHGPLGLDDRPRPGRPPRDRLARHIVDALASNPIWSVRVLRVSSEASKQALREACPLLRARRQCLCLQSIELN